jgi:hypothetical protein
MAQMKTEDGRVVEMENPPNSDVMGILLDNGTTVWCAKGSYKEYQSVEKTGVKIYFLTPIGTPHLEMVGFTRHIIAHYYHNH